LINYNQLTINLELVQEKLIVIRDDRYKVHEWGEEIDDILDDIDYIMQFLPWYESQS